MTNNPMARRRAEIGSSSHGGHELRIGESLTYSIKNPDGSIDRTYTVTRTNRPYAFDLADAYNDQCQRPDLEYYVDDEGSVRLRTKPHVERQRVDAEKRKRLESSRQAAHREKFPIDKLRDDAA